LIAAAEAYSDRLPALSRVLLVSEMTVDSVNSVKIGQAAPARSPALRSRKLRTVSWVILGVAALLVGIRFMLPPILRTQIHHRLNQVPGFGGSVDEVHVALWRGAYALRGLRIVKKQGSEAEPFFSARNIDFSLAWRELRHGRIVSDIIIDDGRINFVKAATPEASQLQVDRSWQSVAKDIFPIDITHLTINGGRIHYLDRTSNPVVDVYVENLHVVASGLRNRPASNGEEFPAHLVLTGDSIGSGKLSISADGDPLAAQPHFEIHGQIEQVALPALNPFLKAYAGVQINAGTFKLYAEMAARGGRFEGYVKPFFTHIKFSDITQPGSSVLQKAWQVVASGLVLVFKNKPQNELATRIPFSGEFGNAKVGVWESIGSMLHNGFIHALPPALEHNIKSEKLPPPSGAAHP
jgi:hypothetical protein